MAGRSYFPPAPVPSLDRQHRCAEQGHFTHLHIAPAPEHPEAPIEPRINADNPTHAAAHPALINDMQADCSDRRLHHTERRADRSRCAPSSFLDTMSDPLSPK
jgi:hypothetical protein